LIRDKIKEKFVFGDMVFRYYRYLDKFHVEPKSWLDLFEYANYIETDNSVNKLIAESTKQE
jgi:hypothetical protein